MWKHTVTRDQWGRLPGTIPGRHALAILIRDYGYDVQAFNRAHAWPHCQLARTVGSDVTHCDEHGAYVSHGVPVILRTI